MKHPRKASTEFVLAALLVGSGCAAPSTARSTPAPEKAATVPRATGRPEIRYYEISAA